MNQPFLLLSPEIIEGIGPAQRNRLASARITNIGTMFRAGPALVHRSCTGSGKKQVGNWFCACALLRLTGVDAALADLFIRAGIRSVRAVAHLDLAAMEKKLRSADPKRKLDIYRLAKIQLSAMQRLGDGLFFGRILAKNGKALLGIVVDIGEFQSTTDKQGWFAFDSIPAGTYTARVLLDFWPHPLRIQPITIAVGRLHGPIIVRTPGKLAKNFLPAEVSEMDGHRIVNTRSTTVQLEDLPVKNFARSTLFELRSLTDNKARLLSLYLVKRGFKIFSQRADVQQSLLPAGVKVGSVLRWNGRALVATDLTRAQVSRQKRQASLARRKRRSFLRLYAEPGKEVVTLD